MRPAWLTVCRPGRRPEPGARGVPPEVLFVPVGGITPQRLAAYAAADANGFGLGSALYKPGMDVAHGKANTLAFVQAWRQITAPA